MQQSLIKSFMSVMVFFIVLAIPSFALPANVINNSLTIPQEFYVGQNYTLTNDATYDDFDVSNDFTMSIWAKMTNTTPSFCGSIYGSSAGANKNAISAGESSDNFNLGLKAHTDSGGTRDMSNDALNNLNDTEWHLIVLRVDKTNNFMDAYDNQQFIGQLTYGFHFPSMIDLRMGLGFFTAQGEIPESTCHVFLGKPYFAYSALTNSELSELFAQGEPVFPPSPPSPIIKNLLVNNTKDFSLLQKGQFTENTHTVISANNLVPQCQTNITLRDSSICTQAGTITNDAYFRVIWQLPTYQIFHNITIYGVGKLSSTSPNEKCSLYIFDYDLLDYVLVSATAVNSCGSLTNLNYSFNNMSTYYNASGAIDVLFQSEGNDNRNILVDVLNATFVYDPIIVIPFDNQTTGIPTLKIPSNWFANAPLDFYGGILILLIFLAMTIPAWRKK